MVHCVKGGLVEFLNKTHSTYMRSKHSEYMHLNEYTGDILAYGTEVSGFISQEDGLKFDSWTVDFCVEARYSRIFEAMFKHNLTLFLLEW